MAVLAVLPPPAAIVWPFPDLGCTVDRFAQGTEGQMLTQNARQAMLHWSARSRSESIAEESVNDPFAYDSVPLETAFSIRVKYKFVGDLEPLPYPLDE